MSLARGLRCPCCHSCFPRQKCRFGTELLTLRHPSDLKCLRAYRQEPRRVKEINDLRQNAAKKDFESPFYPTAENRDLEAKFIQFFEKSCSKSAHQIIINAIFVICLDEIDNENNIGYTKFIGCQKQNYLANNLSNRWFNHTFQFVFAEGITGLIYEHSVCEGVIVGEILGEVYQEFEKNLEEFRNKQEDLGMGKSTKKEAYLHDLGVDLEHISANFYEPRCIDGGHMFHGGCFCLPIYFLVVICFPFEFCAEVIYISIGGCRLVYRCI